MELLTKYGKRAKGTKYVPGDSLTQQHFLDDANINNVVSKASVNGGILSTGMINQGRTPQFGDFSQVKSYHESLILMDEAKTQFYTLPSQLRKRFNNNPSDLIDFLKIEDNRTEAINLGLIDVPKAPYEPKKPDSVPQTDSGPSGPPKDGS